MINNLRYFVVLWVKGFEFLLIFCNLIFCKIGIFLIFVLLSITLYFCCNFCEKEKELAECRINFWKVKSVIMSEEYSNQYLKERRVMVKVLEIMDGVVGS